MRDARIATSTRSGVSNNVLQLRIVFADDTLTLF